MEDIDYQSILDIKLDKEPVVLKLLDPDYLIKKYGLKEITSFNIFESGTRKFDKNGLFSEEIFGNVIDTKRYTTMAYINLKTDIYQPIIYDIIIKMKKIYQKILEGKLFVKFDKSENDFVICDDDDPDGGTGYSFFVNNFNRKKISPNDYNSLKRKNEMELLLKYKDNWFIDKLIVLPAGIRDIKEENGVISQESVNKLYLSLLSLANSFMKKSNDPIYDSIKFNIQSKVYAIYQYIKNLLSGKYGWVQRKYALRRIALGTRNVSSAPLIGGTDPNDETILKYDEVGIPLYEVLKMVQHHIIFYLKNIIFSNTFSIDSNKAYLINNKGNLQYVNIPLKEIEKFVKYEGLEKMINKFKYEEFRNSPVYAEDKDGNKYYFAKIYKDKNKVYIYRSQTNLMEYLGIDDPKLIDKNKESYLTWTELFYIIAYISTTMNEKYAFITRYPAIEDGSIFPAKIQVLSTNPSLQAEIVFLSETSLKVPRYPIPGEKYIDTFSVHVSRLAGLGMDFDGDTGSATALMTEDANEELKNFNNSLLSIIDDNFNLKISGDSENAEYTLFNLTS